jgi:hypothetical protein
VNSSNRHFIRHAAGTFLLAVAVLSAIAHAVYQAPTSWAGSVMLWGTVALLAWGVLDADEPDGLLP